jgi:hypothetical protein
MFLNIFTFFHYLPGYMLLTLTQIGRRWWIRANNERSLIKVIHIRAYRSNKIMKIYVEAKISSEKKHFIRTWNSLIASSLHLPASNYNVSDRHYCAKKTWAFVERNYLNHRHTISMWAGETWSW